MLKNIVKNVVSVTFLLDKKKNLFYVIANIWAQLN